MIQSSSSTTPLERRLCSADHAASLIRDHQTLACTGFGGIVHPEAVTRAIGRRFAAENHPRDLTIVHAAGQGDWAGRGLDVLAHEGLIRRIIGGHYATCAAIGKLIVDNRIEGYNFPQGVICQLYRDIAAGRPGCITHVGLDTFIDPIHGGGRLNARTTEPLVERVELGGKTWLWYKRFPIHVGIIRGWAADPFGNIVCDGEVAITEPLAIAQAAHNSGGIVIAQVRHLLDKPAPPHQVRVPGILVNHIVVADEDCHHHTFSEVFNPRYCAAACPSDPAPPMQPCPMDERRIIANRACDELRRGNIVNLGVGMPEGIAISAAERGLLNDLTLTVEVGVIGGTPAGGKSFGASLHPHAIIDQPAMFDFYDGRGHDFAALGCAQVDEEGNVNVSRFAGRLAGVGGFVNISQTARRLVFCGSFTTGGLEVAVESGKLRIVKEGKISKFVARVEQLSFAGSRARTVGQEVLYVTERAVFRLAPHRVELIEVAPGIDIESQVLALMPFRPHMSNVRPMPAHVFAAQESA